MTISNAPIQHPIPMSEKMLSFLSSRPWVQWFGDVQSSVKTLQTHVEGVFNVKNYRAKGDGLNDDTAAFLAALAAAEDLPLGVGRVFVPPGLYLVTQQLDVPLGVAIDGVPGGFMSTYQGNSVILGQHTGDAILSLVGTRFCDISGITLYGSSTTTPKTGIMLGRTATVLASDFHRLTKVHVRGYFSSAAVYSIGSEENTWNHCRISIDGGGALYGFYTSIRDDLSISSVALQEVSNASVAYNHMTIDSAVNNVSFRCVKIMADGSFDHLFLGGYMAAKAGKFVEIAVDAASSSGFTFIGVGGETHSGGLGTTGVFSLISTGAQTLDGLVIKNCRIYPSAGAKYIEQGADLTLRRSYLDNPSGYASTLVPAQIQDSYVSIDGVVGIYSKLTVAPTTGTGTTFLVNGTTNFASTATWRTVAIITLSSTDYAGGYLVFSFGGIQQNVGGAKAVLIGTFDKDGAGDPSFTSITNAATNCTVQAVTDGATQLVVQMKSASGADLLQGKFSFLVLGAANTSMIATAPGYSD